MRIPYTEAFIEQAGFTPAQLCDITKPQPSLTLFNLICWLPLMAINENIIGVEYVTFSQGALDSAI